MSEVEPYRTINNEVDVGKKCCQIWQKVAKVAKKCHQMWQKVAKGVLSGSKMFQGLPRASKGHRLPQPPTSLTQFLATFGKPEGPWVLGGPIKVFPI